MIATLPHLTPPKTNWLESLEQGYYAILKRLIALLFLLLFLNTMIELFRYDMVIQPFEIPASLTKAGYSGTVVAHRLQDYMQVVREEITRSSTQGGSEQGVAAVQFTDLEKQQKINIPIIGLSLNTLVYHLRNLLGFKPRTISGDLVTQGETELHLTLRMTNKPIVKLVGQDINNPESLLKQAAEQILKTVEPLIFGQNYCLNHKNALLTELIKNLQHHPGSQQEQAIILILEGCLLKNQADYSSALNKLKKAQSFDPNNPVILRMRGDTLLSAGDANQAMVEYDKAKKLNPQDGGIYTQWARALIQLGKTTAAWAKYQEAAQQDPQNPWVYTDWGDQLAKLKQFDLAEAKFNQALQVDPNYALAYALWGNMLLKQNHFKLAIVKYRAAVNLDPNIAWIYGNWGVALAKQGQYKQAIIQYTQAIKLKPLAWIYKDWGFALSALEQFEQAITQYQQAVKLEPDNRLYHYAWGNALMALKKYEAAIKQYQQALTIEPNHLWSRVKLSYALLQLHRYREVLPHCETLLKLVTTAHKTQATAYALCGLAWLGLQQPQVALEKCQLALKLNEQEDWTYLCLGDVQRQLNQLPAAVTQYQSAAALKPNNALYHFKWGQTLMELKQYPEAISRYQQAILLDRTGDIAKQAELDLKQVQENLTNTTESARVPLTH